MRCNQCAAVGMMTCGELFDRLLALDHSRQEPWGPLHAVAVACYRLQHESELPMVDRAHMLALARAYVGGGEPGLRSLTERVRRANSHRTKASGRPVVPEFSDFADLEAGSAPQGFTYTIADVAVDGDFPAEQYAARVHAWAEASLAAWRAPES